MPTSLWQNGGEGHGSFGEDRYQLLGKGLKAEHDQLLVVVAVSGAVISPDMHDDMLCVCPWRLVQQAGRSVSRCGSSNRLDMQVASGVKPLLVYMSKVGVANQECREPSFLWQPQRRRRLSCAVQLWILWGVGCGRGNSLLSVCCRGMSLGSAGCRRSNGLLSVGCCRGTSLWCAGCGRGNSLLSLGCSRCKSLCSAGWCQTALSRWWCWAVLLGRLWRMVLSRH